MNHLIKSYVLALATQLTLLPQNAIAQDEGFIYGRVTTEEGRNYEGALRWGKEEVYWVDMFNSQKEENPNLDYLTREEVYELRRGRGDWGDNLSVWIGNNWGDKWGSNTHQFACQFGDIKKLELYRGDQVRIELRDGTKVDVDGGSNDIGRKVKIMDPEIGEIELDWDRIEEIEFLPTPKKLERKFGEPLYGTVESDYGLFTGFVQWDHDERVSNDKLDGDSYDGDMSIPFGNIKSIENMGSRSEVILKSGRDMVLRGTNDVNGENDGIIVNIEGVGRVDIPWRDFEKVTFKDYPNAGKSYDDFKKNEDLQGTVVARGKEFKGRIVYDLDEEYDVEVLQGKIDDMEYIIPFRNIKSIEPRGYRSSMITLRGGQEIKLEDGQDVSDRNTGILVFEKKEPVYIRWEDVDMITFD